MQGLFKISDLISKIAQIFGAFCMVCMVLMTMLDVTTRYLFKITGGASSFVVKGGIELTSYLMLFALLSAYVAYVERSQIIVDILTQKMPQKLKAGLMGVFLLLFTVATVIMTWGLFESVHDAIKMGNKTQDLHLPMSPIYAVSCVLLAFLTIRTFIESLRIFKTGKFHNAEAAEAEEGF